MQDLDPQVSALHRAELDAYTQQISHDFEELTLLRTLAEHMEVADITQSPWQVAHLVLPLLRRLVRSELLVLFAADTSPGNTQGVTDPPLKSVAQAGTATVDESVCRALILSWRDRAARRPIVRNRLAAWGPESACPGVRDFILVPVAKSGEILGWLLALNRPALDSHAVSSDAAAVEEYGTVEASLLASAASMLATHARNVQLFKERDVLLVAVVRSMVRALDAKDPYTCGHSERVAMVARRLGQELNLDAAACDRLYLTGLLHDVGKIGVSDAVLKKPGKLSDEELSEMRRHPDDGWAILQDLKQLEYVLPGVLFHHESYDGRGYPDGLRGEAIPRDARILAVADAYDAMSSNRPYRAGMPPEKVDAIFREGRGTQWDPQVVDALFRVRADVEAISRSYPGHVRASRRPLA